MIPLSQMVYAHVFYVCPVTVSDDRAHTDVPMYVCIYIVHIYIYVYNVLIYMFSQRLKFGQQEQTKLVRLNSVCETRRNQPGESRGVVRKITAYTSACCTGCSQFQKPGLIKTVNFF